MHKSYRYKHFISYYLHWETIQRRSKQSDLSGRKLVAISVILFLEICTFYTEISTKYIDQSSENSDILLKFRRFIFKYQQHTRKYQIVYLIIDFFLGGGIKVLTYYFQSISNGHLAYLIISTFSKNCVYYFLGIAHVFKQDVDGFSIGGDVLVRKSTISLSQTIYVYFGCY